MRLKKNIICLCLLLLLLLILTALKITPIKARPIQVSVDYYGSPNIFDPALTPGTQFSINITVDYIEELWGVQITMNFDPTVLRGVSVTDGGFLGSAGGHVLELSGLGFDNINGFLNLYGLALFPKENLPTGGGTLIVITFEVVTTGVSPLEFGGDSGLLNRTGGFWLHPDWKNNPIHYLENPDVFTKSYFDNRPSVYLTPELVKGVPLNENFTISVNVNNMTDLYAYSFYIYWNNSILDAVEAVEGDFLKDQPEGTEFSCTKNDTGGYIYVNSTTKGLHDGVSGQGTLANVTFLVKGMGSTSIRLQNTVMLNHALNPIPVRTADSLYLKVHDIAITRVTVSPEQVKWGSGEPVFINVTLSNIGGFTEANINTTVYYDDTPIGTQTVGSLEMGADETLTYIWNTTGVNRGKYIIKAVASPVTDEASTTDNMFTLGLYTISWRDIAIVSVSTPVSNVFLGHNVTVTVKVVNLGTELETFNVTAYYNETAIATQTVTGFGYGGSTSLKFVWDTTKVALGSYTLSANATIVEGEENTDNNYMASATMRVLPLEKEGFAIELILLSMIPVVFVVVMVLFYWRRRRASSRAEEVF